MKPVACSFGPDSCWTHKLHGIPDCQKERQLSSGWWRLPTSKTPRGPCNTHATPVKFAPPLRSTLSDASARTICSQPAGSRRRKTSSEDVASRQLRPKLRRKESTSSGSSKKNSNIEYRSATDLMKPGVGHRMSHHSSSGQSRFSGPCFLHGFTGSDWTYREWSREWFEVALSRDSTQVRARNVSNGSFCSTGSSVPLEQPIPRKVSHWAKEI